MKTLELIQLGEGVAWSTLLLGIVVSGASAYACIAWFLALMAKISLLPFVVYRLLLGVLLLGMFGF
jgi:undecaprenyl-diphosphatase